MEAAEITALDGWALLPEGLKHVRIRIASGKITSVDESAAGGSAGRIIFPGFIDLHVHAREYVQTDKDDSTSQAVWNAMTAKESFATAGAAAINGGVTLFVAMPNDPEPPGCPLAYARKQELSLACLCLVELAAAVTGRSEPWDDLLYKVYLDPKPSPVSFQRWQDLRTVVARYTRCRLMFHAEDPEFIASQTESGPRWKTRPPEAELRAVDRILDLTAKFGLRAHICHVSTRKAVELIENYNQHSSMKVTSEATPHHLFFSLSPEGVTGAMGDP
ncbi:MAG: amidohydrolase family protein, partial [Desulfomonilaceae bacterium]